MKQIALFAVLAAVSAGAFAQGNVTLYGRVNTSVERQDDGVDDKFVMQNNSSRWGMRGTEDLGGGLKAFFGLEAGFGSDSGAGSGGFSRDSYVGLQSETLGRVQMGLMTSPLYYATADYISAHNHDTGVSADAFYSLPNYYNGTTLGDVTGFVSNAVQYTTPTFGGVAVTGLVSAGEGSATTPKGYEISAVWDSGPIHLGGGYAEDEALGGDKNSGFAIRGLYEMGPFIFGAMYERNDYERDFFGATGKRNHYRGMVMYTFGAAELHLNVGKTDDIGDSDDTGAIQYTLGTNYNLSKRTKVYAFYTAIDNDDNGVYGGIAGPGEKFSSIALGIRHHF